MRPELEFGSTGQAYSGCNSCPHLGKTSSYCWERPEGFPPGHMQIDNAKANQSTSYAEICGQQAHNRGSPYVAPSSRGDSKEMVRPLCSKQLRASHFLWRWWPYGCWPSPRDALPGNSALICVCLFHSGPSSALLPCHTWGQTHPWLQGIPRRDEVAPSPI
ncbi:hypothetical protein DR999_PMT21139 [Platysternon megacephalum]|uniref:Uncharacterized protein n=1 Tax=Platysternon megacephalum TaxID=55544 RepID=A0A4D9DI59_9SAUR|nr:hypothetical protein DR999_PMT21139 [Platysternon megacephalum]